MRLSSDGLTALILELVDGETLAERLRRRAGGAPPFIVQHLHDPRRRWGSTPYGSAIVGNAFVFNQVETTGTIWMRVPGTSPR